MTEFIIARAGFGVSSLLRERIASRLREGAGHVVYIVPDQFEYETEKAVYRLLDGRGLLTLSEKVTVRTFSSLADEILREGGEKRPPADDIVKNIIMHRVIRENKDRLCVLGALAEKPGFSASMVQTLTAFKTAGISADDLSEDNIAEKLDGAVGSGAVVAGKLRDVGMLYLAYDARLSRGYTDKLDATAKAAALVSSSEQVGGSFSGADVFVDCFNDFTGSQMLFLSSIISRAENVTLAFTAERQSADESRAAVFYTVNSQISRLKDAAERFGEVTFTEAAADTLPEGSPIRALSDGIFRARPANAEPDGGVEIISAAGVYEEYDYIAARIKQLADGGMHYSDIAVLSASPQESRGICLSTFEKYDIPVFCDIPEPVLYQPLMNFVATLLAALQNLSVDTVLSLVKTGFLQKNGKALTRKEISTFENYLFEWAIGSAGIKKPFTRSGDTTRSAFDTACAEEVRKAAVEPLLRLRDDIKGKTGDEITRRVYSYLLEDVGIERAMAARYMTPDGSDPLLTQTYQRLWDKLTEILGALYDGLSGDRITIADYRALFCDICAASTLAKPPQMLDAVLVGDIDRTRTADVKAVFIAGATASALPTPIAAESVFSPFETELICERISHLDTISRREYSLKTAKEQYCLSLYRVYRAVSLPTALLCVSFPETELSGRRTERSEVVDKILAVFPSFKVVKASCFGEEFYCRTPAATKQRVAACDDEQTAATLCEALEQVGEGEFVKRLRAAKSPADGTSRRIAKATAGRLYSRNISATSAEKLSKCKFLYFCENGLYVKERGTRSFNSIERGNAVHYAMQMILEKYSTRMADFFKLRRAELAAEVRFYLDEYRAKEFSEDAVDDKRVEYLYNNIAAAATDVLIVIQAEFAARDYRPKLFELRLEDGERPLPRDDSALGVTPPKAELYDDDIAALPEAGAPAPSKSAETIAVAPLKLQTSGGEVTITGVVDRVDMFTDGEGKEYLRVVDYKTGNREFSAAGAEYGVNTQMLMYLFALCDANDAAGKMIRPGAVSYTPAKGSGAVSDRLSAFALLATNHRQSGMYVVDPSTKAEMEKYAAAISDRIRAEAAPEADITKLPAAESLLPDEENMMTPQQFAQFRDNCLDTLRRNINALFEGDAAALPLSYKEKKRKADNKETTVKKSACGYCRFGAICGNAGRVTVEVPSKRTTEGGED